MSLMLEFHGTLVQILIGALFVLISASVSPSDVNAVLPAALALVAIMVLVIRPLAVALATWRSGLSLRERAFVAWMAPRGIVAGATASAFGLELEQAHVPGAQHILPIVFVAIFATVVIYGLTAAPVARLLGIAGARVGWCSSSAARRGRARSRHRSRAPGSGCGSGVAAQSTRKPRARWG